MKELIYLIISGMVLASCSSEPRYLISGNIEGADSVTFLLQKRDGGRLVSIDSAVARNGAFRMKGGSVDYPEMVMLSVKDTRMRTTFYLENSEISINGKLDSLFAARITGSRTQDEYQGFIDDNKVLNERYAMIYNEYQTASQNDDAEKIAELETQAEEIQNEMIALQKSFVRNNPASFVSPSILRSISYEMEADEIESLINAMDTAVANTPVVKELKERVEMMKLVAIGQKAPDFTMNDPEGNPVTFSSKLGPKVLLLDFWAAWCGPCRQENPHVVEVYKEFNRRGFDIFGVSLDQSKDAWLKAIEDDKLTWTHVSDLQYWNNSAARLYAVNAIPANFLINENGIIIARNLRGEALYDKVKELLESKQDN